MAPKTRLTLLPQSTAIFQLGPENAGPNPIATRFDGSTPHNFLLLTVASQVLAKLFRAPIPLLNKNLGLIRRWSTREKQLFQDFVQPPIAAAARHPWFQAKTLELLTLHLFHQQADEPLFCSLLKEKTHRNVRQSLELLQGRLSEPLDLKDLAQDLSLIHI